MKLPQNEHTRINRYPYPKLDVAILENKSNKRIKKKNKINGVSRCLLGEYSPSVCNTWDTPTPKDKREEMLQSCTYGICHPSLIKIPEVSNAK